MHTLIDSYPEIKHLAWRQSRNSSFHDFPGQWNVWAPYILEPSLSSKLPPASLKYFLYCLFTYFPKTRMKSTSPSKPDQHVRIQCQLHFPSFIHKSLVFNMKRKLFLKGDAHVIRHAASPPSPPHDMSQSLNIPIYFETQCLLDRCQNDRPSVKRNIWWSCEFLLKMTLPDPRAPPSCPRRSHWSSTNGKRI